MRIKTKFERWTAIAYNSYKKAVAHPFETMTEEDYLSFFKNHPNKNISKCFKDIANRVNQLLSVKSNVPTPVGSVKNKSKKKVK